MREQLEELRRENMQLRQQLAATVQAGPYQHQPYALRHPAPSQPLHRLHPAALLSQDERVFAELAAADQDTHIADELAAATPLTPRPMAADTVAMCGPEDDARGRVREPGEPTPEKPALKKPARSVSEGAERNA